MTRKAALTVALAVVLLVTPVSLSAAQTPTTSTTTTTLPICFPGNPTHQLGVTCQLPVIDCTGPNPHPACGNFPATPTDSPTGGESVLVAGSPPDPGRPGPAPAAAPGPGPGPPAPSAPAAARPARLSLTG